MPILPSADSSSNPDSRQSIARLAQWKSDGVRRPAPDLLEYEVTTAVRRAVSTGKLERQQAVDALQLSLRWASSLCRQIASLICMRSSSPSVLVNPKRTTLTISPWPAGRTRPSGRPTSGWPTPRKPRPERGALDRRMMTPHHPSPTTTSAAAARRSTSPRQRLPLWPLPAVSEPLTRDYHVLAPTTGRCGIWRPAMPTTSRPRRAKELPTGQRPPPTCCASSTSRVWSG